MDEIGLKKIKTAYAVAKKKLAQIRAKRTKIVKQSAASADESRLADLRARLKKL
jgi:hypothetical protein